MRVSFRGRVIGLSLLVAILAVLYFLGYLFNSETSYSRVRQAPLLRNFDIAHVARVKLTSTDQRSVVLEKNGANWYVVYRGHNLPASEAKVRTLLDSLGNLKRGEIVNTNPALNSEFDLSGPQAKEIVLFNKDGTRAADILVGKPGASGFEDYIRLKNARRVLLTRSSLNFYLSQSRPYWYDLSVLPAAVTGSSIVELKVSGAVPLDSSGRNFTRESYDLHLGGNGPNAEWVVRHRSRKLDQRQVRLACNRLADLEGVDFQIVSRRNTDKNRLLKIIVTTEKKEVFSITAEPTADPSQYRMTTSGEPYSFIVNTAALVSAVLPLSSLIQR